MKKTLKKLEAKRFLLDIAKANCIKIQHIPNAFH